MANDVVNTVKVTKGLELFLELLWNEEEQRIDFNKLIPSPQDLHKVMAGSCQWDKGAKKYFRNEQEEIFYDFAEPYFKKCYNADLSQEDYVKIVLDNMPLEVKKCLEKVTDRDEHKVNYIATYFNLRRYGYPTWYEWSYENWGTKWNAHETERVAENIFTFETAWNGATPIFNKLAQKGVEFIYGWSDRDNTGYNFGLVEVSEDNITDLVAPMLEDEENQGLKGIIALAIQGTDESEYVASNIECYDDYNETHCNNCTQDCNACNLECAYLVKQMKLLEDEKVCSMVEKIKTLLYS